MNPGIGAPELIVIAIIALLFIGPRDLPLVIRRIGQFSRQVRSVARDFQNSYDELGREAELEVLKKEVESLKNTNAFSGVRDDILSAVRSDASESSLERVHPRVAEMHAHETSDETPKMVDKAD